MIGTSKAFPQSQSMYLNCSPCDRTILCSKCQRLSNCSPWCLLAEQLNTKSVRMLLGITTAPCTSYDSALLMSNFICHSLAFWSSLTFGADDQAVLFLDYKAFSVFVCYFISIVGSDVSMTFNLAWWLALRFDILFCIHQTTSDYKQLRHPW
jgi:hypothetical protein